MKTDNLIPAAPLDRRELAPGVQLCFTRLDAPLCPPPLDWPQLLVFDFCRSGRRAIPDGAQYAIVTEGHAAVSFAVPGADFYLPGSQYEALQLFIDPDAVQADSFLTLMGLEIGGIADYFCRGGVHCCPMSDSITAIVDEVWDDAAYAAPGELRYAAVRLIHAPLVSLGAHQWFTDTTNAYRAYSREYLTHPDVQPLRDVFMGYELLAYLSIRATQLGMKACEVPVTRAYPASGKTPTKISGFKGNSNLLQVLFAAATGKYNP